MPTINKTDPNLLKVYLHSLDRQERDEYGYIYLYTFQDVHGTWHWFQSLVVNTNGNYQYIPVQYLEHDISKVKVRLPVPALNTGAETAWVQWEDFGQ